MRIILLKDVGGLGRKGDVKDVSDGFAKNQLIPSGKAEAATPKAIATLHKKEMAIAEKRAYTEMMIRKNLERVIGTRISVVCRANDKGGLFAKLGAEDIAHVVHDATGIEIPEQCIDIDHSIDTLGEHRVGVIDGGVRGAFILVVEKTKT